MDKTSSNSFSIKNDSQEIEGQEIVELIDKNLIALSDDLIKKKDREFILRLNLSKNQFYEITDCFLDFRNLVSLDMTENYLENITNLHYLVNLEILILAKNFISNIGNVLTSLENLQFLDLCFNKMVVNDMLMKTLAQNKNLFSLSLRGNLNYDFEKIKIKCLEMTDNLEILDTIVIYNRRPEKIALDSHIDYKTKKGEKVKIKTLKDYMNVRMTDLNEKEKERNNAKNNDSYIEQIKNRNNKKKLQPRSYYYYSNLMNIQKI